MNIEEGNRTICERHREQWNSDPIWAEVRPTVTAGELIKQLQALPSDTPVYAETTHEYHRSIDGLYQGGPALVCQCAHIDAS